MRAIVFDRELSYSPRRTEAPRRRDEVRVQVLLAGICNTDLEIARGYMGFKGVLGHEFVGRVVDGPASLAGKRVVGEINAGCGRCSCCRVRDPRHCLERTVLGILGRDGSFADYLSLPARNLKVVPDGVADEAAVFTEPLAAAYQVLDHLDGREGREVVVIGDGKLGLLVAQVLALTRFQVTAVGRHPEKLRILRRRGIRLRGADEKGKLVADVVVECSGSPAGLARALEIVKPKGTIVLKSTTAGAVPINLAPAVVNEVRILGSRCGRFEPALEALERDDVDVEKMIHATFPLERGVAAFARAAEPGTLKVLLRVGDA